MEKKRRSSFTYLIEKMGAHLFSCSS